MALFELEQEPYFEEIVGALISGYRAVRPINQEALRLLPLFLLIRRLVSIGWVWDRPELGRRGRIPRMVEEACKKIAGFRFLAGICLAPAATDESGLLIEAVDVSRIPALKPPWPHD